ncbi:MAG TPA: carboxypeptidase-like regulatory domain-containing protein [Planctomycetota bacterium]|nr:carboxypeptidase-like regulatory domain-containing protein [Planctomycetota bacterium]
MRAFLLVFAVAATLLIGWLLLSDEGPLGRSERQRGRESSSVEMPPPLPEGEGVRGPTKPPSPETGRTFSLSGYVRDPGGAPVPGAIVRVTTQRATVADTAGREGEYAVAVPAPICTFDVWANGYLPVAGTTNGRSNGDLDFVFDGGGPWKKDFTLRPAASLEGHVYDDAGQPVKGARVYVIPADFALLDRETVANVATTDERGAFDFPGLPEGVTDVGARATGFLPALVKDVAIPARGTAQQDLRLARGREILVTVKGGAPAIEVAQDAFLEMETSVTAADSRLRSMLLPPGGVAALVDGSVGRAFAGLPAVRGTVLEDGRYRLTGVGLGPADVAARFVFTGAASAPEAFIVEPGLGEKFDTTESELTLTLIPGTWITVNVRDAVTGNALEPDVVRRTAGVASPLAVEHDKAAYLAPNDDRRHTLVFTLDGYQEARLDLPDLRQFADARQRPSFDVAMQPTAQGETGAFYVVFDPPLDGRVALVGRDATGAQRWVKHIEDADKEGRWSVEDVPVGEYAVSVLATGMVPAFLPRVVVARGLKDTYRVTLTRGGGLSLKVTDTEGQLLDQVHLLLKDQAGNQIDVHVLSQVSEGRAFLSVNYLPSAASARADSGLASGSYEIAVYREGYEVGKKQFEVRGTDVAEVEIALAKAAK